MKEEFLHYIWKYSLYDPDKLFDNGGNRVKIISPGMYNRDSGPDFFNARINIAGTEWAGMSRYIPWLLILMYMVITLILLTIMSSFMQ